MDRRRIRHRIAALKRDIEGVRSHRRLHRDRRRRDRLPLVALVGYTNAGKSTLFQALSREKTLVSSRLFSTLDTLIRKIRLGGSRQVLISDTVGFIRKLPHQLVTAFRATLEEVVEADLILHVIDASDPDRAEKRKVVLDVLLEIGAGGHPILTVYNKADLLPGRVGTDGMSAGPDAPLDPGEDGGLLVSAVTGEGLDGVVSRIIEALPE
jgi:GTP-binding protein HflX